MDRYEADEGITGGVYMFQELVDNITNVSVFTESLQEWVGNLSINSVIIFIMMIFMIVGAIDRIRGNKLGYGEQFEEGFNAMGPWLLLWPV